MKKFFTIILLTLMTINPALFGQKGFLHCDQRKIVDSAGNEVILKGIGIGGWMLQEPYMLGVNASAQNVIRSRIEALIGKANTDTFYNAYLAAGMQKRDVDSLAAWGFNSIRLPMHYNLYISPGSVDTFLQKGFDLTDSLLKWCEANKIFLILDLHATPGGQGNDAGIADLISGDLRLWQSENYKAKTVKLWRRLAERYKDKYWIGGYDLINEPNYNMNNGDLLKALDKRLFDTIRAVDKNHICFVEGNWFANTFDGLTPPFDPANNMAYSFHKYWDDPKNYPYDWLRTQNNVPLWLGETGENSNPWFSDAINTIQNLNKVGWAFWTFKKIGGNSILGVNKDADIQKIIDYLGGSGTKPDVDYAKKTLMRLAQNFRIENCVIHYDVIRALIELPGVKTTRPWRKMSIPGVIPASDFDIGNNNYAYYNPIAEVTKQGAAGGNQGGAYRNDGVGIEASTDTDPGNNGYDVGWTQNGEWINYTFDCQLPGTYTVEMRTASASTDGIANLKIDGAAASGNILFPQTGGWQTWASNYARNVYVPAGTHTLKFNIITGNFNLTLLRFIPTLAKITLSPAHPLENQKITFNAQVSTPDSLISGIWLKWKTKSTSAFDSIQMDLTDTIYTASIAGQAAKTTVIFKATTKLKNGSVINSDSSVYTVPKGAIPVLSDIKTYVTADKKLMISAKITDSDGSISSATVKWGSVDVQLSNNAAMQTDTSGFAAIIAMPKLKTTIYYRITATDNDNNTVNSDILSYTNTTVAINSVTNNEVNVYPNPAYTNLTLDLPDNNSKLVVSVFDLQGRILKNSSYSHTSRQVIDLTDLMPGQYVLKATFGTKTVYKSFIKR